ncbi:hypothetical protein BN2476_640015 [Paraburkholderia piptadeniae]|uniref:Uncharacterized protein n=1 Tax=Paraburkholderia piptadeniae TaxID=1701573 RepID=A0A1N7SLY6_9BURK|nr:hypothetical protein BN2476_640015 [Paraburkholderia piptadeniae]
MAERSNAPDSKSGIRLYRIVGSNPTLSAKMQSDTGPSGPVFVCASIYASIRVHMTVTQSSGHHRPSQFANTSA